MLSLSKKKICKEYIYVKKHTLPLYSLEEVSQKFKKSEDKASDMANFYLSKINFDKLHFVFKLIAHSDGKKVLSVAQLRDFVEQLVYEAVENFLSNPMDAVYVSECVVVDVSSYNGRHNLFVSPRLDFSK